MAELPFDTFAQIVAQSCLSAEPGSLGKLMQNKVPELGYTAMSAELGNNLNPPFMPAVTIVRRVYYLRGIKFVFNDSKAAAAALNAALNTRLDASRTPAAPPPLSVTATASAPSGSGTIGSDLKAQVADLTQQMTQLKSNLATGNNNVNIASSFARATATGIELVQLFDRPLAFGYYPWTQDEFITMGAPPRTYWAGIRQICIDFGALPSATQLDAVPPPQP